MRVATLRGMAAGVLAALAAAGGYALELGEPAPELDLTSWAQGEPVAIADGAGKSVFLVAFVETFKEDCAGAMAQAAKLQNRLRANGLEVLLVSTEPEADVKQYLESHPSPCRFGIDENRNTIVSWAGGEPYVPYCVIVDKAGAVAWSGSDGADMEKRLEDVLAGKFDLKKATEIAKLEDELDAASGANKHDEVDALADKLLALEPGHMRAFHRRKDGFERREELEPYRKWLKGHLDRVKEDPRALKQIAWTLITDGRWHWRDPETALAIAKRSVELGKGADADAIDTYAVVLAEVGLLEDAVAQMKKAVAADPKDEDYKRRLEFFEQCLALRQKLQPPARK